MIRVNKPLFTVAMLLATGLLVISLITFGRVEIAKKRVLDACNEHWRENWESLPGVVNVPQGYIMPNISINRNASS